MDRGSNHLLIIIIGTGDLLEVRLDELLLHL